MCRACSVDADARGWGTAWESLSADEKLAARRQQNSVIASLVGSARLTVTALPGPESYLLGTLTGQSEVISGSLHIWETAARLAGKLIDPLDPATLRAVEVNRSER
jgi:hypothetical protein